MGFTKASKIRAAIEKDNIAALEQVVAKYPDIDLNTMAVNMDGYSPMQYAIRYGKKNAVAGLLALGVNPNKNEGNGWTAMHSAAHRGRLEMVVDMLKYGGDPNIRTGSEKNVQEIAETAGYKSVVQVLEPYMKDPVDMLQDLLPQPKTPPETVKPATADKWSLMTPDTVAHIFAPGETGYQITDIFNFAARERLQIVRNLTTEREHVKTTGFDDLPESDMLNIALKALQAQGGTAGADSIRRRGVQLDKPSISPHKNG